MSEWFLKRGDKAFGPYSLQHVKALVAHGKLRHDDLVWQDEEQQWVAASTIDVLFPAKSSQDITARKPPLKPALKTDEPPTSIALKRPKRPEPGPSPLQRVRLWPKPLLFGTFGAIGGLLGALFLGELLWWLLAPIPPRIETVPPLQMRLADSLKVHPDGSNQFQVKIARHGFKGKVRLQAVKMPAGVTVPAVDLDGDDGKVEVKVVEVKVADSVDPGKYEIAFEAKGQSSQSAETPSAAGTLSLIVARPPAHLGMSVSPTVDVYRKGKGQFQVQIARGQFDAPVRVSFPKLPAGVDIRSVDIAPGQDSAMVDVEATANAAIGEVSLTALARAKLKTGDELEQRQSFLLNVQNPPATLALSVSPRVEVYRKGKARFIVRIARSQFDAPVQVTFRDAPDGVNLPGVQIAAGKDDAAIEFEAAIDATVGIKDVTVLAQARTPTGDVVEQRQEFQLEVLPAAVPKADVLFVLDLTSSMQFAINGVRAGMSDFALQLGKQNIDARIGLLGFRDIEDDLFTNDAFVVFLDDKIVKKNHIDFEKLMQEIKEKKKDIFTRDYKEFARMVGQLRATGGGDIPESSVQALLHAAGQGFRADSSKVIIFITDAPPKLMHFKKKTETVADAVKALLGAKIDQFHLVGQKEDRDKDFQPLLDAFPKKNSFNDINDVLGDAAFAALLPKLSQEISRNTVAAAPEAKVKETPPLPPASALPAPKSSAAAPPPSAAARDLEQPPPPPDLSVKALQSGEAYAGHQKPRLILAVGIWTSAIAVAICLLLIAGQNFYLGRAWMTPPDFLKGCGGLAAGLVGGVIVQALFVLNNQGGAVWEVMCRTIGWGCLGAMIGGGMALVVPNLKWYRGLLGGLLGGVVGALGFMAASMLTGAIGGRLLGAVILGFLIGVMIALAEMAFRRFWLELTFSAREVRTVTLGTAAVRVGGDEKLASILVQGAAPLALCYRLEGDRVLCEDPGTGKTMEAPPGHCTQVGNVTVKVCSPDSAATVGLTLRLASGGSLSLGDGMPLTADDIPGLTAQGSDGTVALVSRRPNDPGKLLLRNRSRQTWTSRDADGQQSDVPPGRAVELAANLSLDFGQTKGKLVSS